MTFFSRQKIRSLAGSESGRLWIAGAGPTLDDVDLSLLKDDIVFALNASIVKFTDNPNTWWFFRDSRVLEECEPRLIKLKWKLWKVITTTRSLERVVHRDLHKKGINVKAFYYDERSVNHVKTVLEDALQVADSLGFRECYLVGVDHAIRNFKPYAESLMWKTCHFYNIPVLKKKGLPLKPVSKPLTRMAMAMKSLLPTLSMQVYNTSTIYPARVFEMVDYAEAASKK